MVVGTTQHTAAKHRIKGIRTLYEDDSFPRAQNKPGILPHQHGRDFVPEFMIQQVQRTSSRDRKWPYNLKQKFHSCAKDMNPQCVLPNPPSSPLWNLVAPVQWAQLHEDSSGRCAIAGSHACITVARVCFAKVGPGRAKGTPKTAKTKPQAPAPREPLSSEPRCFYYYYYYYYDYYSSCSCSCSCSCGCYCSYLKHNSNNSKNQRRTHTRT